MPETPNTIAAQRADLLRQVVLNRPDYVDMDHRRLFHAEIGLTVHAFMADTYAATLAEAAPELAEQVAADLAEMLDDGDLGSWAWERATELGHDPEQWRTAYETALREKPWPPTRQDTELAALRGVVRAVKLIAEHGDMSEQARAELNEALGA